MLSNSVFNIRAWDKKYMIGLCQVLGCSHQQMRFTCAGFTKNQDPF